MNKHSPNSELLLDNEDFLKVLEHEFEKTNYSPSQESIDKIGLQLEKQFRWNKSFNHKVILAMCACLLGGILLLRPWQPESSSFQIKSGLSEQIIRWQKTGVQDELVYHSRQESFYAIFGDLGNSRISLLKEGKILAGDRKPLQLQDTQASHICIYPAVSQANLERLKASILAMKSLPKGSCIGQPDD